MHVTLKSVFLVIFLTAAATVSLAQKQFVVQVEDEQAKAVKGATVSVECRDNVVRKSVTDVKGEARVAFSREGTCTFSVSGPDLVPQSDQAAMADYPTGIVLPVMRRSAAAKATGCAPEQTLRNGACGTVGQARAEAEMYCRSVVRDGIAVNDPSGGYRCGCAAGRAVFNEGSDSRCETIRNIQIMAAGECRQRDRDLIASPVDSEGRYECRCPDGREWRDATRDSSGGCVSTSARDERASYCESQLSGSIWTKDRMGRLGCFCPPGTESAGGKCVASGEPGQNCPAGRTRRDGTCVTDAEFEAEFNRSCSRSVRGGIAVPDAGGGFRCGCPSGRFLIGDKSGQRCESRQNLEAEAANDCKRRNPDFVPTEIDIMGRYNCVCPTGYVESRGNCVSKPVETKDSMFVGTWNGNDKNKGVTIIINKDFTGVFRETRPGWPTYPDGGKFTWRVYPGKPTWVILNVGDENMLVNGRFVKAGTILKLLDGYLIDRWSQSYSR